MTNRLLPLFLFSVLMVWTLGDTVCRAEDSQGKKTASPSAQDADDYEHTQAASYELGMKAYNRGKFEEAFSHWLPLAEDGHVKAMVFVGFMYQRGLGIDSNYREAAKWFVKASRLGSAEARQMIADPFQGNAPDPDTYAQAIKWYQVAANEGSPNARYVLATLYMNGQYELEKNESLARQFLHEAALQGHVQAQYDLAQIYDTGTKETEQDFVRARFWYETAAKRGHKDAQYELGHIYHHKRPPPLDYGQAVIWINGQDMAQAFAWFERAAQQGHARAQAQLAQMYDQGEGVKASPERAYFWASLAREALGEDWENHRALLLLLDDLAQSIKKDRRAAVRNRLHEWAPRLETLASQEPVDPEQEPAPAAPSPAKQAPTQLVQEVD